MTVWTKTAAVAAVSLLAVQSAQAAAPGKAALKERMEKRFEEVDTNRNGIITHEEMMANVREKFAELDTNRDGFLTLQELPKEMPIPDHMKERMEKRVERMAEKARENGVEFDEDDMPDHFGKHGKPTRLNFMAKHDKDGDERVSVDEFARKAVRMFKHADLNGDGSVTKAEAGEAMKKRFGKHRKGRHSKPHHGR